MQIKGTTVYIKAELKEKDVSGYLLCSVVRKFLPQTSFLCFWEKAALIYWKTLNISASPSVRLVENVVIVCSMHTLHTINSMIF
jgi:hypothetical protein